MIYMLVSQTTFFLYIVRSNTRLVQTECTLIPRPKNNRKHHSYGHETRLYIAQPRPIFMLDMIRVILRDMCTALCK